MAQKLSLTLIFILSLIASLSAQTTHIKGKLVNEKEGAVSYATVILKNYDSKIVAGAVSDAVGGFEIKGSFSGAHSLEIKLIYCETLNIPVDCNAKKIDLGDITLKKLAQYIGQAEVVIERASQTVSADKTVINTKEGTAAVTGSILDAIKSLSAVTIDNQENISIRGNSNVLILMDGVPTTLTSLSAIPASIAENIEVIYSPDASYDAEGTGGVINIITNKTHYNTPLSGIVGLNYGFLNKVNGNAAINYSGKKFSIGAHYNVKYEEDLINSDMERTFKASENIVKQDIKTNQFIQNHVAGINMGYKISKRDMLNFNFTYSYLDLKNEQTFDNLYINSGDSTRGNRFNDIGWNRNVFEGNLRYTRLLFNKPGNKISVFAAFSQTKGRRPVMYYEDAEAVQKSSTEGQPLNAILQSDLNIKKKRGMWQTGAKITYRSNSNQYQFFEMMNDEWVLSNIFSNDLQHHEIIPALYFMYRSQTQSKFSYNLGLRTEYSCANIQSQKENVDYLKHDFFIAPSATLRYEINKRNSFTFIFSRRISRPKYPQLIPYVNMIDDKTYETGNRDLDPEKITKIDLNYQFLHEHVILNAALYANLANNYITQISTEYQDQEDALMLTYTNGNLDLKTGLDLNLKIKIVKQLIIEIGNNTFFGKTTGTYTDAYNNIDLSSSGWMNNLNTTLRILPHSTTEILLQYFYTTPHYNPQFTIESGHNLNIGITQTFFKNQLTISALLTDPFNTNSWNIYSDNPIYLLTNDSQGKTRMFWLGVSYKFNDFKHRANKAKDQGSAREFIQLGD